MNNTMRSVYSERSPMIRYILRIALLLMPASALYGQAAVYYSNTAMRVNPSAPAGASAPLYTVPNARITICPIAVPHCPTFVNVFSDQALTIPIAQPMKADATGNYAFWIPAGYYAINLYTASSVPISTQPLSLLGGGASTGDGGSGNPSSSFTVGNVAAGPVGSAPVVNNSGSPTNVILDFTFPAPAPGIPGQPGTPGTNGTTPATQVNGVPLTNPATPNYTSYDNKLVITNPAAGNILLRNYQYPPIWPGINCGLTACAAGTYNITYLNDSAHTYTLSAFKCATDAGTTTVTVTNSAGTVVAGPLTCGSFNSYASVAPAITTLSSGGIWNIAIHADGSSIRTGTSFQVFF